MLIPLRNNAFVSVGTAAVATSSVNAAVVACTPWMMQSRFRPSSAVHTRVVSPGSGLTNAMISPTLKALFNPALITQNTSITAAATFVTSCSAVSVQRINAVNAAAQFATSSPLPIEVSCIRPSATLSVVTTCLDLSVAIAVLAASASFTCTVQAVGVDQCIGNAAIAFTTNIASNLLVGVVRAAAQASFTVNIAALSVATPGATCAATFSASIHAISTTMCVAGASALFAASVGALSVGLAAAAAAASFSTAAGARSVACASAGANASFVSIAHALFVGIGSATASASITAYCSTVSVAIAHASAAIAVAATCTSISVTICSITANATFVGICLADRFFVYRPPFYVDSDLIDVAGTLELTAVTTCTAELTNIMGSGTVLPGASLDSDLLPDLYADIEVIS